MLFLLLHMLAFVLGFFLVAATLISAIRTFVLPRSAPVKLTRFVLLSMRFSFHLRLRWTKTYEERDRIMALFAPFGLLALPVVWLSSVFVGYMCMFWALKNLNLETTFKVSGSSLFTLGFALVGDLPTTLLIFTEAAIGLFLIALLIAYLPAMNAAFSRREAAVTLLEVRAGTPPSAIQLFKRYHRIHGLEKLDSLWITWEAWFADLEESHTSLGVLAFFRSPQPHRSWITAAGAILDAASLATSTIDIPQDPQADVCMRAGFLALRHIV